MINIAIVEDGINGFWAQSGLQWEDCLLRLIRDEALRREMGLRGRETVRRAYSLEVNTPRFFPFLRK